MFLFAGYFPLQSVTENASAWLQHMSPLYRASSLMLFALPAPSVFLSGCHSEYGARVAITYVSAYQQCMSRVHMASNLVFTGIPASFFFLHISSVIPHPYVHYTHIHVHPVCQPRHSAFESCQEGAMVCWRDVLICCAGLCRRTTRAGSSSS